MGKVFFITLVLTLMSSALYAQDDMRNYPPEQLTNMEYEAGRNVISEIISENELNQTLEGYAYAGYFSGEAWVIIKKGIEFYECYSGKRGGKSGKYFICDLDTKELNSLFEWNDYKSSLSYDIRDSDTHYNPLYYYFILYNNEHIRKLEFNSSTMSPYKDAQKSKKYRKTLPFTKKQQKFIWKLLGFS